MPITYKIIANDPVFLQNVPDYMAVPLTAQFDETLTPDDILEGMKDTKRPLLRFYPYDSEKGYGDFIDYSNAHWCFSGYISEDNPAYYAYAYYITPELISNVLKYDYTILEDGEELNPLDFIKTSCWYGCWVWYNPTDHSNYGVIVMADDEIDSDKVISDAPWQLEENDEEDEEDDDSR